MVNQYMYFVHILSLVFTDYKQKEENDRRNYFMIKSDESMGRDLTGIKLVTPGTAVRLATYCVLWAPPKPPVSVWNISNIYVCLFPLTHTVLLPQSKTSSHLHNINSIFACQINFS